MNKEFFAYTRVSTVKQGEGVSLDAQTDAIATYAAKHGLHIARWFEEKETAAKLGRTVFTDMIKGLKRGDAQGVIMHKIDRSARNLRDWATVGELQDAGIDVHFAAESVDFTSNGGRLTADIHAVMAAHYIRNLREETLKGINGRLKQGLYPFKAPIGYLDTGKGKAKTICPKKGPQVRHLFQCYASGEHSLLSLVDEAERIGLKSFRGGKVSKTCIEGMLANPFYVGLIYIRRRGETYDGIHKPLLPTALFQKVQKVRAGKSVKKVTKHDCTYRRMFDCGRCNRVYCGERQKGHTYYRCHTKGCTQGGVREEVLDRCVAQTLLGLEISGQQAQRLEVFLVKWGDSILKPETSNSASLAIGKLKRKQEQLLDAYLEGLIDKPTFEDRRAQFLLSEREHSDQSRDSLSPEQISTHTTQLFELLQSPYLTYSLANSAEKRQMLEILFSNRTIDGQNVELAPQNWTRKATDTVTVLHGAHLQDAFRKGQPLPVSVTDDLNALFSCPEWTQITLLYRGIHDRSRGDELPKTATSRCFSLAA